MHVGRNKAIKIYTVFERLQLEISYWHTSIQVVSTPLGLSLWPQTATHHINSTFSECKFMRRTYNYELSVVYSYYLQLKGAMNKQIKTNEPALLPQPMGSTQKIKRTVTNQVTICCMRLSSFLGMFYGKIKLLSKLNLRYPVNHLNKSNSLSNLQCMGKQHAEKEALYRRTSGYYQVSV